MFRSSFSGPAVALLPVLLLALPAFSADLKVQVTDPQSAVIADARVALYNPSTGQAVAIRLTSATGIAEFTGLPPAAYRVEILAAGFAPRTLAVDLSSAAAVPSAPLIARMEVAGHPESVTVTAAQTPLAAEDTAASTEQLDARSLMLMQPVAASDAMRFLPGVIVNAAGRRGALSGMFVRGGDSRYNKVIVDGVPVNEPGGIFDFGVLSMAQVDRLEFVRGAESVLYGSDAMTSVVQSFSATGHTRLPELRLGAEGGNFSTARGSASMAGAISRVDYNIFGEQLNTAGQDANDDYSNSTQGANLGAALSPRASFRFRTRHSNNRTGVANAWTFNGQPLLAPDTDQYARQNNFLAGAELDIAAPSAWQHRFSGYEYNHRRLNRDAVADRGCFPTFLDCDFTDVARINRSGFDYRGEFAPRQWGRTAFGYSFEDENGFIDQDFSGFTLHSHGLRRNHALYAHQVLTFSRASFRGGLRYVNNETFGSRVVPSLAASVVVARGGALFSGTRLRFAYAEGIKEPSLEEAFGAVGAFGPVTLPNPHLKPEQNRSFETGFQQDFQGRRISVTATYFNQHFRNKIDFSFSPAGSQFVNLNSALAHGAELELHARPASRVSLDASYTYTATQILEAPLAFSPASSAGAPLLRRPRHAGTVLADYFGGRWAANASLSVVGRRPDSDFGVAPASIDHANGYARLDLGGYYDLTPRVTAYANLGNALDRSYEEVLGYPALRANFRAGMRFRIGGDRR